MSGRNSVASFDRIAAVARFADDPHRGIGLEQLAQGFAEERMIIGNDDGD